MEDVMPECSEIERAWKYHHAADQLLHERVSAFFLAQAFLIASYSVFKSGEAVQHIKFVPYVFIATGLVFSVLTFLLNWNIAEGIKSLKERYLWKDPVYRYYLDSLEETWQRRIIPTLFPILMCVVWLVLAGYEMFFFQNVTSVKCV